MERTVMWTLEEGIEVVKRIREPILTLGYATALTGGVLYRGYSDKDLDLLFYPLEQIPWQGYKSVINQIILELKAADFFIIDHKEKKSLRITGVLKLENEKRIDLFFPTHLLQERLNQPDSYKCVYRDYHEHPFVKAVMDNIGS